MIGNYTHTEFDLSEVQYQLWGYRALPFPAGDIGSAIGGIIPKGTIKAIKAQYKHGKNGVPVIVPLGMGGINSTDFTYLPIEVMVKIQAKQRIVRRYTHHQNNKGSIKEQWGIDDYSINIRGFLHDDANIKEGIELEENVKFINKMAIEELVKVDCPLLSLFDIQYMAITRLNFPFDRSGLEIIPFAIDAVSDFRADELLTEFQ